MWYLGDKDRDDDEVDEELKMGSTESKLNLKCKIVQNEMNANFVFFFFSLLNYYLQRISSFGT